MPFKWNTPSTFGPSRGGAGFEYDYEEIGRHWKLYWAGPTVLGISLEASRRAINDVSETAYLMAHDHPAWHNDTGQTEEALFWKEAEIEWVGTTRNSTPHVWGEWGVEDKPRRSSRDQENVAGIEVEDGVPITTVDVALWLEFGTYRMTARPWLYPVWDETKHMLPGLVREHRNELVLTNWRPSMGGPMFMGFEAWFRAMGKPY